ncbi:hypothetical protein M6D81_07685 [Paenibacillus sp. J5C_2022]|uniref:hypothetical protein n=1 Tax=Paenibacillus sp. J5C2022 TaxID=2977129 RepID=UPI0021D0CBF0|nr:hypothetical protein [Paenibacillus sp. J5C2022]MCU6708595.1 hypothetical protein [Paenibacillus sp. J5C2022]
MRRLIGFELYKIFQQKSIYIFLFILLVLITVSLNGPVSRYEPLTVHKMWEGELTQDKIDRAAAAHEAIMAKESPSREEWKEDGIYENIAVLHTLRMERETQIAAIAEQLQDSRIEGYERNRMKLHISMLERLDTDRYYSHRGPAEMIDFVNTFGLVMTGALMLIGLSAVFSNDYATRMDQFLFSAKYGRSRTVIAKIIASMAYTFTVVLVWNIYNAAHRLSVYGGEGWKAPLQSLFKYRDSPYQMDLAAYYATQIGMHLAGAIAFMFIILLISALCKHSTISIIVNGALFTFPIAATSLFDFDIDWLNRLITYSYTGVMKVEELFRTYITVNVATYPLPAPVAAVGAMLLLSLVCYTLMQYILKQKEAVSGSS